MDLERLSAVNELGTSEPSLLFRRAVLARTALRTVTPAGLSFPKTGCLQKGPPPGLITSVGDSSEEDPSEKVPPLNDLPG